MVKYFMIGFLSLAGLTSIVKADDFYFEFRYSNRGDVYVPARVVYVQPARYYCRPVYYPAPVIYRVPEYYYVPKCRPVYVPRHCR